ncbi:unnamed protein product [Eretmochelys imbricata]
MATMPRPCVRWGGLCLWLGRSSPARSAWEAAGNGWGLGGRSLARGLSVPGPRVTPMSPQQAGAPVVVPLEAPLGRAPRAVTSFPVLLVPPACLKGARSPLRQEGSCSQPGGRRRGRGPLCSLQPQGRAKSFPAGRSASFASLHPAKERPSSLGVTAETGWQRPCVGSGAGG